MICIVYLHFFLTTANSSAEVWNPGSTQGKFGKREGELVVFNYVITEEIVIVNYLKQSMYQEVYKIQINIVYFVLSTAEAFTDPDPVLQKCSFHYPV